MNPSTAMRMVDRLATAALISKQTSPRSGREIQVDLTRTGRTLVDEVTGRRRTQIAGVIAKMTADQRHDLIRALRAFTEAGGEARVAAPIPLGWT